MWGMVDTLLYPRVSVGALSTVQVVILPARVSEEKPVTATVLAQAVDGVTMGGLQAVDALAEQDQREVYALLHIYQVVFSTMKVIWVALILSNLDEVPADTFLRI